MPGQFVPRAAAVALTALALLIPFRQTAAQESARHCAVPKEQSGMVRGDRVPSGCLLSDDPAPRPAAARLFVSCEAVIAYTPNYRRLLLENCLRLSDGRLVIPLAAFGAGRDGRGFSPIDRQFEPLLRPFEPLKRPFEPLDRSFEPLERPFGSGGPRAEAEPRRSGRR